MASASKSIPFVVPAQQVTATETITQQELALLISLRDRLHQLEVQVEEAENSVKARLVAGSEVEAGLLKAFLKTTERRSVAWKAVCERQLGEDYCKRVLAATKPDTFTRLVVEA
jgi:hypothetical protein